MLYSSCNLLHWRFNFFSIQVGGPPGFYPQLIWGVHGLSVKKPLQWQGAGCGSKMTARSGCFSAFLLKEIKVVKCLADVLLLSLRSCFSLAPATQLLPYQDSTHISTLYASLVLMFKTHSLYKKVASGLPETWPASWKKSPAMIKVQGRGL